MGGEVLVRLRTICGTASQCLHESWFGKTSIDFQQIFNLNLLPVFGVFINHSDLPDEFNIRKLRALPF